MISVAEANTFKPHVATYAKAAELCSVAMGEVLFVANHEFDCVGAKARACAVFIDRRRPFAAWPHQLDVIVASMTKLVAAEPAGPLGSTIATATPWSRARPTSLAAASVRLSRGVPSGMTRGSVPVVAWTQIFAKQEAESWRPIATSRNATTWVLIERRRCSELSIRVGTPCLGGWQGEDASRA